MPIFQYTAMDSSGKEKKGRMEAANEQAVNAALKEQGMFPTTIKEDAGSKKTARAGAAQQGGAPKKSMMNFGLSLGTPALKTKDLTILTRQIAILLDAGLPLVRSLRTLEKQAKNPAVKKVMKDTADSVEGGSTFSEALSQHPKSFDKLYLNMIRAGEAAGAMEVILDRLAKFMEKAAKLAAKIKAALIYPVVVLTIALLITSGLMIFIVPKFEKIFSELLEGEKLPPLTQFVIGISNIMQKHFIESAIVIGIIVVIYVLIGKTAKGRFVIDWVKYRAPLFGPIISKSSIGRFSRTLGTLMSSGVPVLNALQIVRDTSGNEVVSQGVQKVHDAVKEGEGLAGPLAATKIFPDMVISMIEVGEETGKLPDMLEKIAETYDDEVDNAVEALTSMIEPLMIIFLAVVVGTIVIALFMPLIAIINKLGG
ncbi:MAG TPA: pilus assembly protein PilC [Lentisphaeria bacterium]|nr:MAG: pilus assembly protein PilC [Lentisphaerae bacterium GWF2_50_93]HCE45405.1 pilus assembly protein PilC [Lentisphaeria bacterium]